MKTSLRILGGVLISSLVLVGASIGALYMATFAGLQSPRSGPALPHGIEQIANGHTTIFLVPASSSEVVLIDAGADPLGKDILKALEQRGMTSDSVKGIFITHAHPDHGAAIGQFPKAKVYAMRDEQAVASGQVPFGGPLAKVFGAYNKYPFTVTHPMTDGESVQVGNLIVTGYEVSGHTPGSAAYLAQGVLFTGDALNITRENTIRGPIRLLSEKPDLGEVSLKSLFGRLSSRAQDVEALATSHTGNMLQPQFLERLKEYADQVKK